MPRPDRDVLVRRHLPASPTTVWPFLVSPEGVATWLGRPSRWLDACGPATIAMVDGAGQATVEVVVESVDPPRALSLLWRWPGEATSLVELSVEPSGDGCTVSVRHARLDAGLHEEYRLGWADHLERLQAALPPRPVPTGGTP